MVQEDVMHVKELLPLIIRGNFSIVLDDDLSDSGGLSIKDKVGFTMFRFSSNGNLHIRGDVKKDL